MGAEWKGMCNVSEISIAATGIESHNSLNAGEALHASLRRILDRLEHDHPDLKPEVALSLAVHAMNCTVNADGLCPMLLFFGVPPSIPGFMKNLPTHVERAMVLRTARAQYEKIVSARRVQRGLRTRPPSVVDADIQSGDIVYVYREKPKR